MVGVIPGRICSANKQLGLNAGGQSEWDDAWKIKPFRKDTSFITLASVGPLSPCPMSVNQNKSAPVVSSSQP